jgi:predicted phage tail component-like protein
MSVSVKFDGIELNEYIDVLQGFTPFTGADWQPATEEFDGAISGSRFNYQRYGAKEIPMPFRIRKNLKSKYDNLQKILNVTEPKQLIFGNISDRYYLAIPSGSLDFEQVWRSGNGTIVWIVPDGLAHALTTKTFTAELNDDGILEATIVNDGSVEVPISYEITHNHDNGYIGIVSDQGVLQLGQPQEIDGETQQFSEKLLTIDDFIAAPDDHTTCQVEWDADTSGTCTTISQHDSTWLGMGEPGSGNNWNGGQKTVDIPEDSKGERGALTWELYMFRWFQESNPHQFGEMCVNVMGDEHTQIAGVKVYDKTSGAYAGVVEFWANGKMYDRKGFRPGERTSGTEGQYNVFHWSNGYDGISKSGEYVTFHFNGKYFPYRIPELKDIKATRIQVSFFRYGAHEAVTRNVLKSLDFTKHHIEKWVDLPNRFVSGDIVKIDGESTKIYVNGLPRQEDEVRGSAYPKAVPGTSKVQFFYSDFCDPPPTIKAEIREAYL